MNKKILILATLIATVLACGKNDNDGTDDRLVKVRVGSGGSPDQSISFLSGLSLSRHFATLGDPCAFTFYIGVAAEDIANSPGTQVSTSFASLSAATAAGSGAELVNPAFSTELLVPRGKSRRIRAFGAVYSTCAAAIDAIAYPIFGETPPIDINEPADITLDAIVHLGGFNVISSATGGGITTEGSPFITASFNSPDALTSNSRRIIVTDKATGIYFAKVFATSGTSPRFTAGPFVPNRTYNITIDCTDSVKYNADFTTPASSVSLKCWNNWDANCYQY
ncbi:MAG: hypothetical protein A2583_10460 [Bdellovibrionales bacterium RIFOXYD1_FULL_53_11]|nr:MAG: hypothetical protein A2583_10460 [Bdellovibrionales bacterium RIFOXYD1_FULL_53_11]